MQSVSQAWKNAQLQTIVPESFVEISIKIGNPDAQSDAEVTTNGSVFYSDPQEIVEGTVNAIKYATLEPFLWVLDGTYRIIGENVERPPSQYVGFIPYGETVPLRFSDGQEFYVTDESIQKS